MLSNLLENGEECIEKCNFYNVKYFDKIKCYADRPYLVFSEVKPETHTYIYIYIFFFFFFGLKHDSTAFYQINIECTCKQIIVYL